MILPFHCNFGALEHSIHTKLRSGVVNLTLPSALCTEFKQKPSEWNCVHQRVESGLQYRNLAHRLTHQMKAQDSKLIWDPDILTGSNRSKHAWVHFSKANLCPDLYPALIIYLSEALQARYVPVQNLLLCIRSCMFNIVGEKVRKQGSSCLCWWKRMEKMMVTN